MLGYYVKRGAVNSATLGISSFVVKGVSFYFLPYFLSQLTLADFGIWDFYQSFFSFATLFFTTIASNTIMRHFFLYREDPEKQRQVIGNAFLVTLVGVTFFACIAFLTLHYANVSHLYLGYTVASVFFYTLYALVLVWLRLNEWLVWYMVLFLVQNLLAIFLNVVGIHYGYGIVSFFYATLCSFALFVPYFFVILKKNWAFSLSICIDQLRYVLPLVLYSIVYSCFFMLDRFFIKYYADYHVLGSYGLLWRFGQLFQFVAISLIGASPIVFFPAHQENDPVLINKLMFFYTLTLISSALGICCATYMAMHLFFPAAYNHILLFIPLFITTLLLFELARSFQISMQMIKKTWQIFVLNSTVLALYIIFLYACVTKVLWTILIAQAIVYLLYFGMSLKLARYYYHSSFVNVKKTVLLLCGYMVHIVFIQLSFFYRVHWSYPLLYLGTWVFFLCTMPSFDAEITVLKEYVKRYALYAEDVFIRACGYLFLYCFVNKQEKNRPWYGAHCMTDHLYSDGVTNASIVIIGPLPPPLESTSIHVKRLVDKLLARGNTVFVHNPKKKRRPFFIYSLRLLHTLWGKRPDIIYYHASYMEYSLVELLFLYMYNCFFRSRIFIIEHDCRYLCKKSMYYKSCHQWFVNKVHKVIFMGAMSYKIYSDVGIHVINYAIETAFLPPITKAEAEILKEYPRDLLTFTETHSPLIVANAFRLSLLDGKDLYGFDMCIDLLHELRQEYPSVGMVFSLISVGNLEYYKKQCSLIEHYNLSNHIYIMTRNVEFWPIIKKADLFIRPTLSDVNSVSVEEAIYFNVPTVASDVCPRPKGTSIFKTGDKDDFFKKVKETIVLSVNAKSPDIKRQYEL